MSDETTLRFRPLQLHELYSLPAGFEYEHEISEASNTIAFNTGVDARDLKRCVVCGRRAAGGPRPSVTRAHIVGKTEDSVVSMFFLFQLNDDQFRVVGFPEGERPYSFIR
jgi:hypothetical protein